MKTWGKMFARGRRLRLSAGRGCIRKPVAARGFVSGRGPKTDRTAGRNLFLDSRRAGFGRDEAKRKVCGTIPLARLCLRPSIAQSHFVHEKGGFSWMKLGRAMVYRKSSGLPAVHWRGALPIPPKRELYSLRLGLVPDSVHFSQGHVGKETSLFYRMVLKIGKPAAELLTGSAQRNLRIDAI